MKKLLLSFFVLVVFTFTTNVFSQAFGDYGSAGTNNAWNTASNWVVCVTAGTWVGATTAVTAPTASTNVWILNTHTVTLPASGNPICLDLNVENGGILKSANLATAPRYVRVYGNVNNEGTIGGSNDGISLYVGGSNCTLSGNGSTSFCRLQPQAATTVTFNTDVNWVYNGGSGVAAIYCNGNATTININAGRTVSLVPTAYVSVGTSGSNDPGTGANMTLNIYGTLTLSDNQYSNINLRNTSGLTTTLNVYNGGIVNCGNSMWAPSAGAGTAFVNIYAGGQVNFVGSAGTCDISKATTVIDGTWDFGNTSTGTRSIGTATIGSTGLLRFQDGTYPTGSVSLNAGSTVEYYGGSAITLGTSPTAYSNLLMTNTAGVTLGAALAVSNLFSIVSGASIDLGSFTHSTEYLKLAGVDQSPGTHGSTASTATYQNSTYFGSSATGLLIVNAALPVELASFNANAKNGLVQLSWRTISETNSLMFDVQRKSENSEWTKIGEVIAAGNSNSPKDYSFADSKLTSGKYQYRLKMIDGDGSYQYSNIAEVEISLPAEFSLSQNYPNPFNPSTTISYQLAANSFVTLKVYDILGNEIATLVNEQQETGFYSLPFTTSERQLANGMYIYKIQAGNFTQTKKMLLIK